MQNHVVGVCVLCQIRKIYIMKNVETNLFNGKEKEKQPGKHSNKTVAVVVGFDILVSLSLNGKDKLTTIHAEQTQKQYQAKRLTHLKIQKKSHIQNQCVTFSHFDFGAFFSSCNVHKFGVN